MEHHSIIDGIYVCITVQYDNISLLDETNTVLAEYSLTSDDIMYGVHNVITDSRGYATGLILVNSLDKTRMLLNITNTPNGLRFSQPIAYSPVISGVFGMNNYWNNDDGQALNPHKYINFDPHEEFQVRCCTVCGENARCSMRCKGSIYYETNHTCEYQSERCRNNMHYVYGYNTPNQTLHYGPACRMQIIKREGYEIQYNSYVVLYKCGDRVDVCTIREECDIKFVLEHNNILYIILLNAEWVPPIIIPIIDYALRKNLIYIAEGALKETDDELTGQVSIFNNEYWLRELLTYV